MPSPGEGISFLCGSSAYACFPTHWTGLCTLVYVLPKIILAAKDQPIPIPVYTNPHPGSKRAPVLVPLLAVLGAMAMAGGVAARITRAVSVTHVYSDLSLELAGVN